MRRNDDLNADWMNRISGRNRDRRSVHARPSSKSRSNGDDWITGQKINSSTTRSDTRIISHRLQFLALLSSSSSLYLSWNKHNMRTAKHTYDETKKPMKLSNHRDKNLKIILHGALKRLSATSGRTDSQSRLSMYSCPPAVFKHSISTIATKNKSQTRIKCICIIYRGNAVEEAVLSEIDQSRTSARPIAKAPNHWLRLANL